MSIYEYKGFNKKGKTVRGHVESDNSRNARLKLKRDGIYVSEIKDRSKSKVKKSRSSSLQRSTVNVQDLSTTTRQMATLIKASIPLVETLEAISQQTENSTLKTIFGDLKNAVNEGSPLYKALQKYPKVFNKIYITMVEAGEASGTLDIILIRLAEFLESQHELSSRIRSAMTYPIVMIVFTFLILIGMFTFLVPQMREVFEAEAQELPVLSEFIFNLSDFVTLYYIPLGLSLLFSIFMFLSWKKSPKGSMKWDAFKLNVPVFGKFVRLIAVGRFTRTLSTLLTGGVPVLEALRIVQNVVNNHVLSQAIGQASKNIKEGESVAGPLKKSGHFPPIVIHMIHVGEKTGELETMLNQVSDAYEFQVKNDIEGLTSLLSPILMILMGGVITVIMFAVLMPMFEMQNLAG